MGKETALQGSSQQAVATDSGGHVGRTSNSAKSVGRPDPALLLLEPLLQQGEAGPSTWKVKQVEAIRSQLSDAIRSNKTRNLSLVSAQFADISTQVRTADHVNAEYARVDEAVQGLESQMDVHGDETSFLPPVLDQLSTHFRHVSRRDQARAHAELLRAVRAETEKLRGLEEAVWSGRGAQAAILDAILSSVGRDAPSEGMTGTESASVLHGTKVYAGIEARLKELREIVSYQVEKASAKFITTPPGPNPSLVIRRLITLPEPNAPRPDRYPRPAPTALPDYTIIDLYSALHKFGKLDDHLDRFDNHIREIIMPTVWVRQTAHIMSSGARDRVSLLSSPDTNRPHDDPQEYIYDAQYLILFIDKHLLPSSEAFSPALSESLDARKTALYRHIVDSTLRHILIPATPSAISDIPSWIALCQTGGQTIMTNTLNSKEPHAVGNRILESISTIADFADGQAGETYTERRVEAALEEVKKLVLGGWGGWDAMEVQKEREEIRVVLVEEEVEDDAAKLQQSIVPQSQLHDETAAAGEADGWGLDDVLEAPSSSPTDTKVSGKTAAPDAGDADEAGDGWGFDDEAVTTTEPTTSKSSIVKPPIDTAGDTEMDEGWDFDLASTSPTTTTAPAQVAPPAAPPKLKAREAKKLGKKIGQKKARLAAQEVHSGSEDVDMASSVYSERSVTGGTSNAGAVSAPVARGTAQADGWGWEEDDQSPAARVGPSPKAATVPTPLRPGATQPKRLHTVVKEEKIAFTDTYLVSKSCRALIDLVQRCLDEATALHTSHTDLNLPSQFADNAYRLVTAASSVLTLFRALIFASPHVSDVPTLGMQLSNDCAWLADHLPAVPILAAADLPTWDREAVVSLMQSASAHAYETQLDTQRTAMLRVIEEMPDLVAIGEDENHRAAMRSVEELKGTIDSLGRVWKLVLPRSQYLAALGHLVDITLSHLITSVLALVDIPQIESDHLVEILTELKSIESMGIFDSQPTPAHAGESGEIMPVSSIATHVPHWLKFVYLIEMLGASLVDIGQLLDHGALIDFEKEELIRLIRALFAESEVREGVVSRIEAAS